MCNIIKKTISFLLVLMILSLIFPQASEVIAEELPSHIHSDECDSNEFVNNFIDGFNEEITRSKPSYSSYFGTYSYNDTLTESDRQSRHDDYFSIERYFIREQFDYSDEYRWELSDGKLRVIYIRNEDNQPSDDLETRIIGTCVSEVSKTIDAVFYTDGSSIFRTSYDGLIIELIFEGRGRIRNLIANSDLVFFFMEGIEYRIHLETGIIDLLVEIKDPVDVFPYSTTGLYWWNKNPDYLDYLDKNGISNIEIPPAVFYYFNELSGKSTDIKPNGFDDFIETTRGFTPDYLSQSTISFQADGKTHTIPYGVYLRGTYFNNTGGSTVAGVVAGKARCNHGSDNYCISYIGSSQCCGFSRYIYNSLYGIDWTIGGIQPHRKHINNSVNGDFWHYEIPLGACVWVSSSTSNGHWVILAGRDSVGFTVYHANWDDGCRVSTMQIDYSSLGGFGYVYSYDHPEYFAPHAHSWGSWYSLGITHRRDCTASGCTEFQTGVHNWGNWSYYSTLQHRRQCTSCPEYDTYAIHSWGSWYPVSGTTTLHRRDCTATGCTGNQSADHAPWSGWEVYSSAQHRKKCNTCSFYDYANHGWGSWANYTNEQHRRYCSTCAYYGYALHVWGSWIYSTASVHRCDCTTSTCNAYKTANHGFGNWSNYSSAQHRRLCSLCSWYQYANHGYGQWLDYSSTQHRRYCSSCGAYDYAYHTGWTWTIYSSTQHKRACTSCTRVEYGSHVYSGGKCTSCGKPQ